MMQLRDFLENFSTPVEDLIVAQGPVVSAADAESQKLESFESGYKAGWDDAVSAQDEDLQRVGKDLAQNLQDLSFTYQEAYSHVLKSMSPLLEEIVNVLLPGLIEDALGKQLLDHLQSLASEIGQAPVEICVHPDLVDTVTPMASGDFSFPVDVAGDTSLSNAQAEIKFGDHSKQIDLNEILSTVKESVEGFVHDANNHDSQKVANNG